MTNPAIPEVNVDGSDDETLAYVLEFESADRTPFPFNDYEIEYSVTEGGSERLRLSQGNGITITGSVITFDGGQSPLRRGEYQHGCRARNLLTGKVFQLFDGTVRIHEGYFR